MSKLATLRQCGTLTGLALFLPLLVQADDVYPNGNYLLIHDEQRPEKSRLLIFNDGSTRPVDEIAAPAPAVSSEVETALAMIRQADPRQRVRGLTILSGDDSAAALDAGMDSLYDSDESVREEAIQLLMSHPDANIALVSTVGRSDPSARVRRTTADLVAERSGD